MKQLSVISAVAVGIMVSLVMPVTSASAASVAQAGRCYSYSQGFLGWTHTRSDNDIEGIRAPLLFRADVGLCTDATNDGFVSVWLGIETQTGYPCCITQAGYDFHFNSSGNPEYCRFWAIDTGIAQFYHCNQDVNGTSIYFKIEQYKNNNGQYYYNIWDCGTSTFNTTCTQKSGSEAIYSNPESIVAVETDHQCSLYIAGSSSDKQRYGNSTWDLTEKSSTGWAAPTWRDLGQNNCTSHHFGATTTDGVSTWDDRNTS